MPLKVLHVLDHSVPLHSGYAFRTLAILREQRKLGWRTLQVTTPKHGASAADEEEVEGFTFLRTRHDGRGGLVGQMLATRRRLAEAIARFEPDLIHCHSPILTALPGLAAARRARLPLVYEVRATWEDAAVDHGTTRPGSARYRVSKALETFVLRRADHVTTICEGLRREIGSRGIAADSITVIPNAVDIERFEPIDGVDPAERAALGLGDSIAVGFIGSFYGYEGLDLLLEAVAAVAARGRAVHAVLVGGGPEDARLRAAARDLGIDERVRFVGRVGHDEVQRYYRALDALVYPRRRTKLTDTVTPLKPLEAMAQGKLVLASDVGGHRELVHDGQTGLLFAADDAGALAAMLERLIDEPGLGSAFAERARGFVAAERNWTRSVAGYRRAYAAALAARGRPAAVLGERIQD